MATGRKTVVVGQVIDPVGWGNPLWDQSVQSFASAADRTAQFPAPKQGAPSWLEDVKRLDVYDGAAWTPVALAKPVVLACPLAATWTPPGGYSAPRLSLVAGRWTLTATWVNTAGGSFGLGFAPLLTIPAGARVAGMAPFQVPTKQGGFPTGTAFLDVNPATGAVQWYLPAAVASAAAGALSGGAQVTWDAQ